MRLYSSLWLSSTSSKRVFIHYLRSLRHILQSRENFTCKQWCANRLPSWNISRFHLRLYVNYVWDDYKFYSHFLFDYSQVRYAFHTFFKNGELCSKFFHVGLSCTELTTFLQQNQKTRIWVIWLHFPHHMFFRWICLSCFSNCKQTQHTYFG